MIRARALTIRSPRFPPALGALALVAGLAGAQKPQAGPPSRELLLELTASPRLAGTCGSLVGAKFVARKLEEAGWKVEIDEREVMLSLPRTIEFAIYEDAFSDHALSERIERFDPDAIPPGDVPKCNGWSASGNVRARVVDVGRGLRPDFERLKTLGVDVRGAIALVRYGGSYRGIKVDLATQFGCSGVLFFSDPGEDGPEKGPTWPAGPWKPDWEAQRGSINPIAHIPGDPSTPGWPSPKPGEKDAKRASTKEIEDALPRIPCIPVGWRDAKALIEKLAAVATKDKDGKDVEERLGPGPVQVRMKVDQPRDLRTIHSVIARLPGESERTVIAGAHRDAWVRGANDDGAGTVAMMRAAQILGEKMRSGWKPKNTVTIAFWDGEEFGLIGSTEWGEANEEWLRKNAIAYVNADTAVNGAHFRGAGGSPGMLPVLKGVLERIPALPGTEGTAPANLWEEWREAVKARAKSEGKADPDVEEPRLGLPGSGSDFAVFVHHLNIPCLEPSFSGSGGGGQYHTTFDDFTFVEKYVDPGFVGHELAGKFLAELLAELADREGFFDDVGAAQDLARRAREAATDERLAASLERIARSFDAVAERRLHAIDFAEVAGEPFYRHLEVQGGLEGRPWFRNRLWAPGLEDGYGSETFPTLRAAAPRGEAALAAETNALVQSIDGLLTHSDK